MKALRQQTLLIDADDTLWENNIYFERVIEAAQKILRSYGVDPLTFRNHLNELERRHIVKHGYGTLNFTRSLLSAFESHLPPDTDSSIRDRVQDMALGIMNHELEIIEGVPETLRYLSGRHALFLVTKGDPEEQTRKIESSGLSDHFLGIEILPEKNPQSYLQLV